MGPTWVLSAPDGPHVDPMNIAIRVGLLSYAILALQCCPVWRHMSVMASEVLCCLLNWLFKLTWNIKAPYHWSFVRSIGDRWIDSICKGPGNAENVSKSWRHHGLSTPIHGFLSHDVIMGCQLRSMAFSDKRYTHTTSRYIGSCYDGAKLYYCQ